MPICNVASGSSFGTGRDRDQIYGAYFDTRVDGLGIEQVLTAPRSPWQNPFVERMIGSIRRESGEVVAGELTSKRARDSSRVASLVGQIDSPISSARADTAYDAGGVYEAIENHSAHRSPRVLIPPRKGALLASGPASSRQRNRNIAAQARLGKRKWHTESGYSKRSKSRDNVPSLQGYRGLSDASERVGGTES